ncbi:hypothetical protein [Haloglycomyces albus]|uniref:hypothetical protein n=1 Tax=Haloglycomyces albus TaxID=526067 RepID=UPI0004AF85B7|nr:hypothetical protein [Haloglycomyces albus]
MVYSTPSRPHDFTVPFPELKRLARSAIRLHPRNGSPQQQESSIGGPLLWPSDEPWPLCGGESHPTFQFPSHQEFNFEEPLDLVYARRAVLAERDAKVAAGEDIPSDWAIPRLEVVKERYSMANYQHHGATPLLPVLQVYRSDVLDLPFPDQYDLLQLLWCPYDHTDIHPPYNPAPLLIWRDSTVINSSIESPPLPSLVGLDNYVPEPCVLEPEEVTEYPDDRELEANQPDLSTQIDTYIDKAAMDEFSYIDAFASAPGWKLFGHGGEWGAIDPYPIDCHTCDSPMQPLITVDSAESNGNDCTWRRRDEDGAPEHVGNPPQVVIGRWYQFQVFYCPSSATHSPRYEMY